jgi:hemerythrin superfamily protein
MTYDLSKSEGSTGVFIKGGGTPKFYKSNEDRKVVEKRWLEDEVKNADSATKCETGVSPYSKMNIDHEYWEKEGVAKKVSAKEARQRKKNARKLTQEAAKNVNAEHVSRMTKGGKEGVRKGKE